MLKTIIFAILSLLYASQIIAQCDERIEVSTQAELDATNPCPIMIEIDLSDGDIVDLSILQDVIECQQINISNCNQLINVDFPSLERLNSIAIVENEELVSVTGFNKLVGNVSELQGYYFLSNPKLELVDGFHNVTAPVFDIFLDMCPLLEVSGFENIPSASNLFYNDVKKFPVLNNVTTVEAISIKKYKEPVFNISEYFPRLERITVFFDITESEDLIGIGSWAQLDHMLEIQINNNPNLLSLPDIGHLQNDPPFLILVSGNPMLDECCGFKDFTIANTASVDFLNNGESCSDIIEVFSGCSCNNYLFNSQEAIDTFSQDCMDLYFGGDIVFSGPDIVDISRIAIQSIQGNIILENCPMLESAYFSGTEFFIDTIIIRGNSALRDIEFAPTFGLAIAGLIIEDNPLLTSFNNELLLSDPLSLSIINNPNLDDCCFLGFIDLSGAGNVQLANNGSNCIDLVEIDDLCNCKYDVTISSQEELDSTWLCNPISNLELLNYEDDSLDLEGIDYIRNLVVDSAAELVVLDLSSVRVDSLTVTNNPNLESILKNNGVQLIIEDNPKLVEIKGNHTDRNLTLARIRNNPLLQDCCILDWVYPEDYGKITLENNGDDCIDIAALPEICDCVSSAWISSAEDLDRNFCRNVEWLRIEVPHGESGDTIRLPANVETIEEASFTTYGGDVVDLSSVREIGTLIIGVTNINSLVISEGSESLERLRLYRNPELTNLQNFENVLITSELHLEDNPLLTAVPDVKLDSVMNKVVISAMPYTTLEGLDGVQDLGSLEITSNIDLVSISGFNELKSSGTFVLADNPRLNLVTGFSKLIDRNMSLLSVQNNPSITDCCFLDNFNNTQNYNVFIENNGFNCTSIEAVYKFCACDDGPITISTQTELDYLTPCDTIRGDVIIRGEKIELLAALSRIDLIEGDLIIENCDYLRTIEDLNPEVLGKVIIRNNATLASIIGFDSSIVDLEISDNQILTFIDGFSGVDADNLSSLVITNNPLLEDCCFLKEMPKELYDMGVIVASNNNQFCNSYETVITNCSFCEFFAPLTTQAEVDQLSKCDSIAGNLIISGNGITNLLGALNIQKIFGSLYIEYNPDLTRINEFRDVTISDSIVIRGNANLRTIAHFHNPQKHIVVRDNSSLTDVSAFANYRVNRNSLQSLELINNPVLDQCCFIQNYPQSFFDNGTITVAQNGTPCSTPAAVIAQSCNCTNRVTVTNQYGLNSVHPCPVLTTDLLLSGPDFYDLSNLEHVHTYEDLTLRGCSGITSLDAFRNINWVKEMLIESCDNLTSISDFYGEGASIVELHIRNNAALQEVILESSNMVIEEIYLNDNPVLESFTAYGSGTIFWDELVMRNNPNLTECCIALVNPTGDISDNGQGCSSEEEIINKCDSTSVVLRYFMDTNLDGLRDSTEQFISIPNGIATSDPAPLFNYIIKEENHHLVLTYGDYQIIPVYTGFAITNSADDLMFTIDENSTSRIIEIGLRTDGDFQKAELSVISTQIERCSRDLPFKIKVTNLGNMILEGGLMVDIPLEMELLETSHAIIDSSFGKINFEFDELDIFESDTISLTIKMPSEEFTGNVFCIRGNISSETEEVAAGEHCFELRCAVDPNDKHGTPFRGGDNNYTLFEENLDYTIRFENLGNDTAFDIRIEDQLSHLLKWETFRLVSASHDVSRYEIDRNGLLNIYFDNILLPSKEQDTIANKGYVNYSIEPMDELDEFSLVENTAGIYFDFNAPVITNTTLHTYVSEIPTSDVRKEITVEPKILKLFPNPASEKLYIHSKVEHDIELYSMISTRIDKYYLKRGLNEIDLSSFPSGMYLVKYELNGKVSAEKFVISR